MTATDQVLLPRAPQADRENLRSENGYAARRYVPAIPPCRGYSYVASPPNRKPDLVTIRGLAPATDPLLTVDQAAGRLQTSPRFIRRLIFERRIPFYKLGRHVRLQASDLDAYIAAGRSEQR